MLAGLAIPAMLLAYGAALRLSPPVGRSGHNREVALATVLKLAVMPALAAGVALLFGLEGAVLLGVVITAALPTAQNIFLHATRYRVGEGVSRETILVTTVCSLPVAVAHRAAARLSHRGDPMPPTADHPTGPHTALPDGLLRALLEALGPAGVLTAPADVAPYASDWTGTLHGRTPAVLRPSSTDQVAAAVRLCSEAGVAVVPQGGNTGLCGGAVPDESGVQVVLSLGRMRRVREVDPVADTMTLEAGVVLATAQEVAAGAGRLFPLSLGVRGQLHDRRHDRDECRRHRGAALRDDARPRPRAGGRARPTVACGTGCGSLRKDNTGYDLKQLFIGAEGTLGIVTAAVLRLFPATPRRATAWVALPARRRRRRAARRPA